MAGSSRNTGLMRSMDLSSSSDSSSPKSDHESGHGDSLASFADPKGKGKQIAEEPPRRRRLTRSGFMVDARQTYELPSRRFFTSVGGFMDEAHHAEFEPSNRRFAYNSGLETPTQNFTMQPKGGKVKETYMLSKKIYDCLLQHQKDGLEWLWNIHCRGKGGILADDMGLGKTKLVSSFVKGLLDSNLINKVLIIIPSQLHDQWIEELTEVELLEKTFLFREMDTRLHNLTTVKEKGGVLITSYKLAADHWSKLNISWDYMILDEAHYIKDRNTTRYKSLSSMCSLHKILMTGTPAPNSLQELRALLDFCCPGLFSSDWAFRSKFLTPLVQGNYKGSTNDELIKSYEASRNLQGLIKPYFLRRMKDVLSSSKTPNQIILPEKTEVTIWLKLSSFQEQLYRTLIGSEIIDTKTQGDVYIALTLLQKICNHPRKLIKGNEGNEPFTADEKICLKDMVRELYERVKCVEDSGINQSSCKIEVILKLLELFHGAHRVLIFSRTVEMLNAIQVSISRKGYAFNRIDGTMSMVSRQREINAFKRPDGAPIFLISSRVGGTGLDLPVATRTIIVEPDWNPSNDDQIADRIYRMGQSNDVVVYRLIASETIEEYIYQQQLLKAGTFKAAIEEKISKRYVAKKMGKKLLTLPPNGFGCSRTQKQLEKETLNRNLPKEVDEEISFLKKQGIVGVTIHNKLFMETMKLPASRTSESKRTIRQPQHRCSSSNDVTKRPELPSRAVDERYDLSPPDKRALKIKQIESLEKSVRNHEMILEEMRFKLPDQGLKLRRVIDELNTEIAELRSSLDKDDSEET